MKRTRINWAALLLLSGAATLAHADDARRPYIVQLADAPTASYTGGVANLAATRPATGSRLDLSGTAVLNYINYLDSKRNQVLSTISAGEVIHKYDLAFNGFSAMLTDAEARKLKADAGVAAVELDVPRKLTTNYTPGFMGLNKPGGLWDQLGGAAGAGEGIIIGHIDSGVWPEDLSFADRVDASGKPSFDAAATLAYGPPPASWKGACETGEAFTSTHCNNKLIGARSFSETFLRQVATLHPAEFRSPRDTNGHGTHTLSTAGGNAMVDALLDNNTGAPRVAGVSGMAPRARVAAYKICFSGKVTGAADDARWTDYDNSCFGSDAIAAINQAIKDGVNVLNYSISGSTTNIADAVDVAFKGAVDAGIFVAASAGNSGPGNTVAHLGPWMTTVGNATHDRLFVGTITLGNNNTIVGASSNANTPSSSLILAENAGVDGLSASDKDRLKECFGMTDANTTVGTAAWVKKTLLDPAKVNGKLLVCNRGNNALVNKSANAKTAGASGVIIANIAGGNSTVINQGHGLSTVHVSQVNGDAIKAYMAADPAAATGAMGNLQAIQDPSVAAPAMSDSSSRGPNQGNLNLLKPDVAAPGSSILAAYTPDYTIAERDAMVNTGQAGRPNYSMISGTSMSSPHVAGVAAALMQRHPGWSPAAIRSALMTTAKDVANTLTGVQQGAIPFGQGAGFIQPSNAADPGLIYDIAPNEYNRFLCGVNRPDALPAGVNCASVGSMPATDLNLPSITSGALLGSQVFTRRVTNVGPTAATYTATVNMPNFTTTVTPASLSLEPGETKSFQLRVTRGAAAPLNAFSFGSLTWTDGQHVVRSPVTVRPVAVGAPAVVSGSATTGNKVFPIATGFDGAMSSTKLGLTAATRTSSSVTDTNTGSASALNTACLNGSVAGVKPVSTFTVTTTSPVQAMRFSIYDKDVTGSAAEVANTDLDLILVNTLGQFWYSGNLQSNESIIVSAPSAATYRACVVGFQHAGSATSTSFTVSSWLLRNSDPAGVGNLTVSLPSKSYIARTASAGLSWSGLATGQRFMGQVTYQVNSSSTGVSTLLVVEPEAAPAANGAALVESQVRSAQSEETKGNAQTNAK